MNISKLLFLFSFIFSFVLNFQAQDIKTIVKYRAEINDKYVDSFTTALKNKKDVAMHIKQTVVSNYLNATPDFFELHISGTEAYYFPKETLQSQSGGVGSLASMNPFYTNRNDSLLIGNSSVFGQVSYELLDWKITGATKKIGDYLCYAAKATEHLYSRRGFYYDREVIAWFTPQIPLGFGPSRYTGLPGLIMQVQRDKFTITATEVILKPKEGVTIKAVKNLNKVITEEETHRRISQLESERG